MPFKRKYGGKRRFKSKPKLGFATKKVDRKQNKAIVNLSKRIAKINKGIELKQLQNYQSSYNNTTLTTTWNYANPFTLLLNGSIQGTSTVTRIGDKIKMTSMHLTGQIYQTAGGTVLGINTPVRILVYLYKKPRGVAPTLSQSGAAAGSSAIFYNSGGVNPSTYQQYDTGVNGNMYENYKILFDKIYPLKTLVGAFVPSTDAPSSVNPYVQFNIRKKLNLVADYSRGTSGTILDIESNAIYVSFITDTNSGLTVEMDSRIYFTDL